MRMTIDIPDPIYRRLKSRAASGGTTIRELILQGVRSVLKRNARKSPKPVNLPMIRSNQAGTLELDNDKIFEIIPFP
jgi:hypothetical protein